MPYGTLESMDGKDEAYGYGEEYRWNILYFSHNMYENLTKSLEEWILKDEEKRENDGCHRLPMKHQAGGITDSTSTR